MEDTVKIIQALEKNEVLTMNRIAEFTGIKYNLVKVLVDEMVELGTAAVLDDDEVILTQAGDWSPSA